MTRIAKGIKVRVAVELKQVDGTPIESSAVDYVHGAGGMLKGLEAALEGMEANQTKEGVINAKDAFGLEEDLPTMKLPRAQFPKEEQMDPGRLFEAKDPNGRPISFKLVKLEGDQCVVRLLHPLAGKDIKYKVKVLAVTDTKAIPPPPAEAMELAADELSEET